MLPCSWHHLMKKIESWMCFPVGSAVTNLAAMQETQEMQIQSLGWEDPLEGEMAMHSSFLVWNVPWTEEPGGLQSKGLLRLGHNWARANYEKFPLCSRLKEQKIKISIDLCLYPFPLLKDSNTPNVRLQMILSGAPCSVPWSCFPTQALLSKQNWTLG